MWRLLRFLAFEYFGTGTPEVGRIDTQMREKIKSALSRQNMFMMTLYDTSSARRLMLVHLETLVPGRLVKMEIELADIIDTYIVDQSFFHAVILK